MRYGNTNDMRGSFELSSCGFAFGDGGGSITECDGDLACTVGSGNAPMDSADDVSMVI